MSQLEKDYSFLRAKWFVKPSLIKEKNDFDEKTKEILARYRHLLLNRLFLKSISDEEKWKALSTWKNNWKKDFLEKYNINWITKEIISYPLEEIYSYIENNLDNLKWDNLKQIEVSRIFWIKNLGTFYRIVKTLGFLKKLEWKLINLPVDKFKNFNIKLEEFLLKNDNNLKWQDVLNIWKEIWINNPEFLYWAISALWIAEKYKINKVKIASIELVEEIYNYINKKYNKYFVFDRESVFNIINEFEKKLWKNQKANITKITSLLRFYWYEVGDIREYN